MNDAHPIAREPIFVWQAPEGQHSAKWIAKFGEGRVYPIVFSGDTEAAVRQSAEDFRADVIARFGASYLARLNAMRSARAAKARRKAAGSAQLEGNRHANQPGK